MVDDGKIEILQKMKLEDIKPVPEIYFGGPVNLEMGLILHDSSYKIKETLNISRSIRLTSNKQIIEDIKLGNGPGLFRFSLGYAGWDGGQLEEEIEKGDWLIIPAKSKLVFSTPDLDKWKLVVEQYGINYNNTGGSPGFA